MWSNCFSIFSTFWLYYISIPERECAGSAGSGAATVERVLATGAHAELDLLIVVAGGDPFSFDVSIVPKRPCRNENDGQLWNVKHVAKVYGDLSISALGVNNVKCDIANATNLGILAICHTDAGERHV